MTTLVAASTQTTVVHVVLAALAVWGLVRSDRIAAAMRRADRRYNLPKYFPGEDVWMEAYLRWAWRLFFAAIIVFSVLTVTGLIEDPATA